MSGTARAALALAGHYADIGYTEGPHDNETIFGEAVGAPRQRWCGAFVKCCLDWSGTTGEPSPVSTRNGAFGYQRAGRWLARGSAVRAGDLVFFDWGHSQSYTLVDHVAFVVADAPAGSTSIETIEGNTSSGNHGSQSNGGGVYRRTRPRNVIAGFGRPLYAAAGPVAPPHTTVIPNGTEPDMFIILEGIGFFIQFGEVTSPLPDMSTYANAVQRSKDASGGTANVTFVPQAAAGDMFKKLVNQTLVATGQAPVKV